MNNNLQALLINSDEMIKELKYENLTSYVLNTHYIINWFKANQFETHEKLQQHYNTCRDCFKRLEDWVQSNGEDPHPYITRQIDFIKCDFDTHFKDTSILDLQYKKKERKIDKL